LGPKRLAYLLQLHLLPPGEVRHQSLHDVVVRQAGLHYTKLINVLNILEMYGGMGYGGMGYGGYMGYGGGMGMYGRQQNMQGQPGQTAEQQQ
jgi:hypothetical protein